MKYIVFTYLCCFISCAIANESHTLEFHSAYQDVFSHSLELKAAIAAYEAKKGERMQAAAYPNPELSVTLDSIGHSTDCEENELSIELVQLLEMGGKRSARMRIAEAEKKSALWTIEIVKCDLYANLLHAFIDVAIAQERLELTLEQLSVAEQTFNCISTKTEVGKSSYLDCKKAEVAAKSAKIMLAKQKAIHSKMIRTLLEFWHCCPPCFDKVFFPLFGIAAPPDRNLLEKQLSHNPELSKAEADSLISEETISLEMAERVPDIAVLVGVSTERFTHDPTLSLGISIPLPLFDQNRGNIYRASFDRSQTIYNQLDLFCHLKTSLYTLYDEWSALFQQAIELKETVLPAAQESYSLAKQLYEEGKFDYLAFLDARNTLFIVQQQYLDTVGDYQHKRAEIMRLTNCFSTIWE